MTLPEVCPLDENQTCKGRECHLFCLEWRTREPTCVIGYNITSKVRSGKDNRKKDTYAEDTFRKLGRQPLPRMNISEKGDWTPTRSVERPPEGHLKRREEKPPQAVEKDSQKCFFGRQEAAMEAKTERLHEESFHEESYKKRVQGRQAPCEAEQASLRLEARLKKDPVKEDTIIYAKTQPMNQEKPKVQEKVISRDKHTTIFSSRDEEEKKKIYPSGREEKPRKPAENRDKRKKLEEVMDIDLPDNYEEEFWS